MFVKIDKKWQKWYKSVKNDQTEYIYTCQEGSLFTDIHHLITTVITLSLTHLDLVPNFRPIPNHLALWSGSGPSLEFRTLLVALHPQSFGHLSLYIQKMIKLHGDPILNRLGTQRGPNGDPRIFVKDIHRVVSSFGAQCLCLLY